MKSIARGQKLALSKKKKKGKFQLNLPHAPINFSNVMGCVGCNQLIMQSHRQQQPLVQINPE
jgi:hypothetical protein